MSRTCVICGMSGSLVVGRLFCYRCVGTREADEYLKRKREADQFRQLIERFADLQARVARLESEKLARFGRSVTVSDAEIELDDPWTGVVGFFKD